MKRIFKIQYLPLAIILVSFFSISLILVNSLKTIKTSVVKVVEHKGINLDNISPNTTPELAKIKNFYETDRNMRYLKRLNISFLFFISELKHGMNLFQTSNEGSGIRMELQSPSNLVIQVRTRDANEIVVPLSYAITANKWYNVNLSIDEKNKTTVIINNETVYSRTIRKMDYFIDDIAIGTGLSKSRNFEGIIKNLSLKYELLEPSFRSQIITTLLPVSLILSFLIILFALLYLLYPNSLKISNFSFYSLFLPLLFLLNMYFYSIRKINYFMGDDIFAINFVQNVYSFISLLIKSNGNVFRPILSLAHFIKYSLFGINYDLWFYSNILHSFLNLLLIFYLTYIITWKNKFLSACVVLLVLASQVRVWLYMWWPTIGTENLFIETWSLLCLIFLFQAHYSKSFIKYLFSLGFYFLLINTHESNLVLTPLFLLFVFLEKEIFTTILKKIIGIILPIFISITYYIAKVYIAQAEFFVAAASGGNYKFNHINLFGSVIPTYLQYILQFFNINLSKVAERGQMPLFSTDPLIIKSISIITVCSFILIAVIFIKSLFEKRGLTFKKNKSNKRIELYSLFFIVLIIVPASLVPTQMELRWVESSYIVLLMIYVLLGYQVIFRKKLFYKLIFIFSLILLFTSNYYHFYYNYLLPESKIVQVGSQGGMDEAIRLKEEYGNSLKNYRIFVDIPGYFEPSLLFLDSFYPGELFTKAFKSYEEIYINPVNTKKNLILRFDSNSKRYIDVTNDFYSYLDSEQTKYGNLLTLPVSASSIHIESVKVDPRTLSLAVESNIRQSRKCESDVFIFINNFFFMKIPFRSIDFQTDKCHFVFSIPRDRPPKEFELKMITVKDGYSNSSFYKFNSEGSIND